MTAHDGAPSGYGTPGGYGTASEKTSGLAVASMILGILSLPPFILTVLDVLPIGLALLFGFVARAKVRSAATGGGYGQPARVIKGAGMAMAGIVCGFVALVLAALLFVALVQRLRREGRV
jgi:hypothetical protein